MNKPDRQALLDLLSVVRTDDQEIEEKITLMMKRISAPLWRRDHVLPIGDSMTHAASLECPCFPVVNSKGCIAHNAKDCREAKERHDGKRHSEGWMIVEEYFIK